jgi:peroxiredoxin
MTQAPAEGAPPEPKKTKRFPIRLDLVLVVVVIITGYLGFWDDNTGGLLEKGAVPPDFDFVHHQGGRVKLADYKGKVVVLDFWATWCPPCVEEMPSLVEMQRRMKAKGITVLAVSVDVDQGAYLQFLKEHNVNLLTVRDPGQKSNALYGTFRFPETYVIDRNGVMRRKFVGGVDWTAPDITEFLGRM